jgi:hypothetical protein
MLKEEKMNTSHNPAAAVHDPRPAALRPPRTRRTALALLDAALALQVAAWITVMLTVANPTSAFSEPHPGFRGAIIVGGAIWLVQFAAAVLLAHKRARSHH